MLLLCLYVGFDEVLLCCCVCMWDLMRYCFVVVVFVCGFVVCIFLCTHKISILMSNF